MPEDTSEALGGLRLLVVEDEFIIAIDLAQTLEDLGAEVVGPAGSVRDALDLVKSQGDRLDGAVLDVNLRDQQVFPVADALAERGVPFVFTTGYDTIVTPERHAAVPRCEKPVDKASLVRLFSGSLSPRSVSH
jgi:DNA-binding NtrC family response regulator